MRNPFEITKNHRSAVFGSQKKNFGVNQKAHFALDQAVQAGRPRLNIGDIANFKPAEEEGHKVLRVYLKYGNNNEAVITDLARVSRPGCRVYVRRTEIPRVLGGMGINILTTPKGVMTGRQARRQGLGGELLCEIW